MILNFLKNVHGSRNFRKISQNRLNGSNFSENFLKIVKPRQISSYRAEIVCANALILMKV